MKVMIARLNHETNTFSPVPTPLSAFGNDGPAFGAQAYAENKGKRTAMSAFIDIAEANGATVVTPVSATAYPSGRVSAEAYSQLCDAIVAGAQAAAPSCWICMARWWPKLPTTAKATCSNACDAARPTYPSPWRWTCTAMSRPR